MNNWFKLKYVVCDRCGIIKNYRIISTIGGAHWKKEVEEGRVFGINYVKEGRNYCGTWRRVV